MQAELRGRPDGQRAVHPVLGVLPRAHGGVQRRGGRGAGRAVPRAGARALPALRQPHGRAALRALPRGLLPRLRRLPRPLPPVRSTHSLCLGTDDYFILNS